MLFGNRNSKHKTPQIISAPELYLSERPIDPDPLFHDELCAMLDECYALQASAGGLIDVVAEAERLNDDYQAKVGKIADFTLSHANESSPNRGEYVL